MTSIFLIYTNIFMLSQGHRILTHSSTDNQTTVSFQFNLADLGPRSLKLTHLF